MSATAEVPRALQSGPQARKSIALLRAEPDLLRRLDPAEAAHAMQTVRVPLVEVAPGVIDLDEVFAVGLHSFAAIVTSGLLTQEVALGSQPTLRVLGPGDVLTPAATTGGGLLAPESSWAAGAPSKLALLDDHFLHAARRWPRLLPGVVERAADSHGGLLMQLAVCQMPRVEDRLMILFSLLAERWGRVTPEGVVVTLRLTHEALGRLVGARRPTVTLALNALSAQGRLSRHGRDAWLLADADPEASPVGPMLTDGQRPRLTEVLADAR